MEVCIAGFVVCSPRALHRECVLGMLLGVLLLPILLLRPDRPFRSRYNSVHPASVRHPHCSQVTSVTLLVQFNTRGFIGCSTVTR